MDKEIINEYIKVADEKLGSARLLFENKKYSDAVSRAYYAVFHCAQAMLISLGIKAESHSGVRHLFGIHFVKEGRIDKKFARYLKNLKEDRESGDYGIMNYIDNEDAENALAEANEFVEMAKAYLDSK